MKAVGANPMLIDNPKTFIIAKHIIHTAEDVLSPETISSYWPNLQKECADVLFKDPGRRLVMASLTPSKKNLRIN